MTAPATAVAETTPAPAAEPAAAPVKPKPVAKPKATAKPGAVAPGTRYLALGDSVTFGYMESTVVPAPVLGMIPRQSPAGTPSVLGQIVTPWIAGRVVRSGRG